MNNLERARKLCGLRDFAKEEEIAAEFDAVAIAAQEAVSLSWIARKIENLLAAPGPALLTPYGEDLFKLKQGYFCGNCGADLSTHPVSAGTHACPIFSPRQPRN